MYIFDKQSIIFHVIRICTCVHEAGENKIPAYKQIHETESSRKERNSNLELYRIIVMLLIGPSLCCQFRLNVCDERGTTSYPVHISLFIWNVGENRYQLLCDDYRLFYV